MEPTARRVAGPQARRPLPRAARLPVGALLAGPLGWLVLGYLGSLAVLLVAAFWRLDPFTAEIIHDYSLRRTSGRSGRTTSTATITLRTVGIAAAVTVTDALLAFPIAFYMAKVASPRTRALLVVAVLMPLWASYLVKVYAWRIILQEDGVAQLGCSTRSGSTGPASATSPSGSSSATSGCRT